MDNPPSTEEAICSREDVSVLDVSVSVSLRGGGGIGTCPCLDAEGNVSVLAPKAPSYPGRRPG